MLADSEAKRERTVGGRLSAGIGRLGGEAKAHRVFKGPQRTDAQCIWEAPFEKWLKVWIKRPSWKAKLKLIEVSVGMLEWAGDCCAQTHIASTRTQWSCARSHRTLYLFSRLTQCNLGAHAKSGRVAFGIVSLVCQTQGTPPLTFQPFTLALPPCPSHPHTTVVVGWVLKHLPAPARGHTHTPPT